MLQLDPRYALFRSAPRTITVGAQYPALELPENSQTLTALAALVRGVLPQEFEQLLGPDVASDLLQTFEPVLASESPLISLKVRGRLPIARTMQRAARAAGHPSGPGIVVAVSPWRLPPREVELLVEQQRPHLPVIVGDAWVQIGPFSPGNACARCVGRYEGGVLPAHLVPVPSPAAKWQTIAAVLTALQLASRDELPAGWGMRASQSTGAISALAPRPVCECRSRRGIARAA